MPTLMGATPWGGGGEGLQGEGDPVAALWEARILPGTGWQKP